jgi:tetratricopeptide (TPR) repeat protein
MERYRRSREVLEILVAAHPEDDGYRDNLAAVCNEIGLVLGETGQTALAVDAYGRARQLREVLVQAHPAITEYRRGLGHTLHQLGSAFVHGDRPAEAVEPLGASRALFERLVKDHPENLDFRSSLGGVLNDLGLALAAQRRQRDAVAAFKAAIEHQQLAHTRAPKASTYTRFLANHYGGLSDAQGHLGEASAALESARRAIELREELVKDHSDVEQYRLELARAQQDFAFSLRGLNHPGEAIESYGRARNILEQLVRDHPDDLSQHSALGGVLNDLGITLAAMRRGPEAMAAFEKAIEHQRFAHERAPEVPQHARFLANHYMGRGMLQHGFGRKAAAQESFAAALDLREALVRAHPNVAEFKSELIPLLDGLGMNHVRDGTPSEGLRFLERARKLQEELSLSKPDDPILQMKLGGILNDHGMALAGVGRHPEAIDAFRAAVQHQRNALSRIPGSPQSRHFLSNHYWNLCKSMRALGRPEEAATAARESAALSPGDPDRLYSMACELSLCVPLAADQQGAGPAAQDRYARWALDALRQAVAAGFRNFAHMQVDSNLDPLRGRDDFRLLMMDLAFPARPLASGSN